jgi:hypothetical protein
MTKRTDYLTQRLEKGASKTRSFFKTLDSEMWQVEIYSEGASWSIRQILAHFVSTEQNILRLVASIVQSKGTLPEDFELDRFNEDVVKKLENFTPDELLDAFKSARQQMIAMVSQFSDTDLDKIGQHPWFKSAPVEAMIKLVYRHNQIHQRDIRKILSVQALE